MRLGDATWTEVGPSPIVVVPVGSCEQHGPHLPIDTDTRIAVALAERLAESMTDVLVAPPIGITSSGEHRGFPGTLSIGLDATETVIVELVRSADWAAGVVLVNGHGGNTAAVRTAVATLHGEGRRVLDWWPRIPGGDAHAGRTETSIMLAIAPGTLRTEAVQPGATASLRDLYDTLATEGVAAVSTNGVLGDPSGSSAAEGAAIVDALVADLVERVSAWR
ncbi:MAG: Creatininase [Ilumatobacteraceae bacterium]|nr:Creatininase [Ilumatobacteraceae bacterium]MCU1390293.1 Creatininase [Ilumatobacteraceae bacterium]